MKPSQLPTIKRTMTTLDYICIFVVAFAGMLSGAVCAYYAIKYENQYQQNKQTFTPRAAIIVNYQKDYEYYTDASIDWKKLTLLNIDNDLSKSINIINK